MLRITAVSIIFFQRRTPQRSQYGQYTGRCYARVAVGAISNRDLILLRESISSLNFMMIRSFPWKV